MSTFMPAYDVYGERRAMEVREDTWGHLAPTPRRRYEGTILIAVSEYRHQGRCVVRTRFPGLDDSPWFYSALVDYVEDLPGLRDGMVYRWTGTYRFLKGRRERGGRARYLDEGLHEFLGTTVPIPD